jgi:hypothetical protein
MAAAIGEWTLEWAGISPAAVAWLLTFAIHSTSLLVLGTQFPDV